MFGWASVSTQAQPGQAGPRPAGKARAAQWARTTPPLRVPNEKPLAVPVPVTSYGAPLTPPSPMMTPPVPVTSSPRPLTPPGVTPPGVAANAELAGSSIGSPNVGGPPRPAAFRGYGRSRRYGVADDPASEQLGQQWAEDLKRGGVTEDQLVAVIQERVIEAPPQVRSGFRHGFLLAYGNEGAAVLSRAMSQTRRVAAGNLER